MGARRSTTGMNPVEPPNDPNYHFMTDMTDQAIDWTQGREIAHAGQAVLHLLRPGATHAPHHVPKEWIAKYKGKFDQGWDKLREETLARQKKLGVVPPDTKLAPKPDGDQGLGQAHAPTRRSSSPTRWRSSPVTASLPTTRSAGWSRPSRTWARWTTRSSSTSLGDNGASAEGGMNGLFNEATYFNGVPKTSRTS